MTGAIAELGYYNRFAVGERGFEHFDVFVFDTVDPIMVNAYKIEEFPIYILPNKRSIRYFTVKRLSYRVVCFRKEFVKRLVVFASLYADTRAGF